jgi:hypothetical protein
VTSTPAFECRPSAPGPIRRSLGGDANRSLPRRGAQASRVCRSCRLGRENAPGASWSRSPGYIDRAWCVFVFLAALLQWQELRHGRGLNTNISNKVIISHSRGGYTFRCSAAAPGSRRLSTLSGHQGGGWASVADLVKPSSISDIWLFSCAAGASCCCYSLFSAMLVWKGVGPTISYRA